MNLVRGMAAGLVWAIFYLRDGYERDGYILTLLIEFLAAFLGGFTADRVLSQLSELRALREHALDQAEQDEGADGTTAVQTQKAAADPKIGVNIAEKCRAKRRTHTNATRPSLYQLQPQGQELA